MKKEKQVCWCYLTWIWCHLCVFFNRSRSTTNENAHWSHVMWSKTSLCRGNLYCAVKEHGNQEMRHATRLVLLLMSLRNYALRNIQFLTTQWSHGMAITSQNRFFREINIYIYIYIGYIGLDFWSCFWPLTRHFGTPELFWIFETWAGFVPNLGQTEHKGCFSTSGAITAPIFSAVFWKVKLKPSQISLRKLIEKTHLFE